jgi:hypothetical protein
MELLPQSMEEDSPSNITVFCKDPFNSRGIDIILMNQIVRRPLTILVFKIIWEKQMAIIIDEKTRVQLKIIKRLRHKKIQGCLKTFKKTWILQKNPTFHKFSINSRLRIYSNLSPFSIILAVVNWVTNNILPVTSKTIWSTKSNLMHSNINGSQKGLKVVNSSFIHKDQILITVPTMRKTLFNKIKEDPIHTRLPNSNFTKDKYLFHNLNHKEICLTAIFLQLNSGQDQQ